MPKGGEPCMFCDEYPCVCNKPARKPRSSSPKKVTTRSQPKVEAKAKVKPAPKPAPKPVEIDHDMNSALRLFHANGMLTPSEVRKHRDKLGPVKATGKLLKYKGGDDE